MSEEAAVSTPTTDTTNVTPSAEGQATGSQEVSASGESSESGEDSYYSGALPDVGDIDISEAALRGEEPSAPPASTEVPPAASGPTGEQDGTGEPPAEPAAPGAEGEGEQSGNKPHPKGYVPIAALHEARGEINALKNDLNELRTQLTARPTAPVAPEPAAPVAPVEQALPPELADFKPLTQEDFNSLVEDDPPAAMIYLNKLNQFKEITAAQQAAKNQEKQVLDAAYNRMGTAIPGLFDKESQAGRELADFATGLGFGPDLFILTNPGTKIIPPGETKPVLLGEAAAAIVEMFAGLKEKVGQAPDEAALRASIEKELRETIQVELLNKFKNGGQPGFQSVAAAPGTDVPSINNPNKVLTAAEFDALSPAAQERYLMGAS